MSPPSDSAASPAPLISDVDVVIMYDSEGEEFEHRHQAGTIYWSCEQHQPVSLGWLTEFCRVVCGGVGDVEGVPPLQQIPQVEVTAEEFARALVWAWGPPMLEWCQNEALCVFCAWRGKACIFDVPSPQKVLNPVRVLGEAQKTQMSGEVSVEQSAEQVGPLQGEWREGASSAADGGKQRASLPLGAGPSKRPQDLGTGIKFSRAPAFNHGGLPSQVGGCANGGIYSTGGGALMGKGGSRCSAGREGGIGVGIEHPSVGGAREVRPTEEVEEQEMVPESGLLRVELEVARQREDWLANEAASGHAGILCWVWEHRVLLDSASAAFVSIQDGLAQMPMGQPPELQQEMARVGRLLVEHRRRNAVAPESWWEVAADTGKALLGLAEVLAVVQAQMEIDLGVGMAGVPEEE
ncbi:hypothetical protein E4T56_gene11359 [Termitomyces sp. T112]|nr:hypothetical protein E4T56_gene11359 [Termitomyces sp. T112]